MQINNLFNTACENSGSRIYAFKSNNYYILKFMTAVYYLLVLMTTHYAFSHGTLEICQRTLKNNRSMGVPRTPEIQK